MCKLDHVTDMHRERVVRMVQGVKSATELVVQLYIIVGSLLLAGTAQSES